MHKNWTLYYKYPKKNFVASFVADAKQNQLCEEVQDTTPSCYSICSKATKNVKTRAERVKTKALRSSLNLSFKLRDVVLILLDDVDQTKVDNASLVGVIVSINKDKFTCRVAVKNGLLHHAYVSHTLGAVPKASNDWVANDLEAAFNDLKGLPNITHRARGCSFHIVSWGTGNDEVQLQG